MSNKKTIAASTVPERCLDLALLAKHGDKIRLANSVVVNSKWKSKSVAVSLYDGKSPDRKPEFKLSDLYTRFGTGYISNDEEKEKGKKAWGIRFSVRKNVQAQEFCDAIDKVNEREFERVKTDLKFKPSDKFENCWKSTARPPQDDSKAEQFGNNLSINLPETCKFYKVDLDGNVELEYEPEFDPETKKPRLDDFGNIVYRLDKKGKPVVKRDPRTGKPVQKLYTVEDFEKKAGMYTVYFKWVKNTLKDGKMATKMDGTRVYYTPMDDDDDDDYIPSKVDEDNEEEEETTPPSNETAAPTPSEPTATTEPAATATESVVTTTPAPAPVVSSEPTEVKVHMDDHDRPDSDDEQDKEEEEEVKPKRGQKRKGTTTAAAKQKRARNSDD